MSSFNRNKEKYRYSQSEIEKQVMDMMSENKKFSKDNAKSLIKNISLSTNMTFQPRNAILCLTLRLIYAGRFESYIRDAFAMMRGLFKDYLRIKNRISSEPRRGSREISQEMIYKTPTVREIGDLIQRSTKYHKKTVLKTRSRPISPFSIDKVNNNKITQENNSKFKARSLQNLGKIFQKCLRKRWKQFKGSSFEENEKKNRLKRIYNLFNRKLMTNGLEPLKQNRDIIRRINFRRESLIKTTSLKVDDSRARSPSFEERDKEIWKRRNPIRNHSPSPSDFSAISGRLTYEPSSVISSPGLYCGNPFLIENKRKSKEIIELDSPQKEESAKADKNEENSKRKQQNTLKGRAKPKALRTGKNENKPREVDSKEKTPKIAFNAKEKKQFGNMLESIHENHLYAEKIVINTMKDAVLSDRVGHKLAITNLIADFIQIFKDKLSNQLKKDAFEAIKKFQDEKKQSTPVFNKKKPALRSKNDKKPSEIPNENVANPSEKIKVSSTNSKSLSKRKLSPESLQLFTDKISVLNHLILKNKLTSFLLILDEKESSNPQILNSFKDIFRILEAKRFSKLFFTFTHLRKVAEKRVNLRKVNCLHFFQKINKIFNRASYRNKHDSFKIIHSKPKQTKVALRLFECLYNIRNRIISYNKPSIFYKIKAYSDCKRINYNLIRHKFSNFLKKLYLRKLGSLYL